MAVIFLTTSELIIPLFVVLEADGMCCFSGCCGRFAQLAGGAPFPGLLWDLSSVRRRQGGEKTRSLSGNNLQWQGPEESVEIKS